jgi:hypothetical protein
MMHASLSLAFGLVVFVVVALAAVAYPGRFRFYAIVTIAILVGFGAASSMAIEGIERNFTQTAQSRAPSLERGYLNDAFDSLALIESAPGPSAPISCVIGSILRMTCKNALRPTCATSSIEPPGESRLPAIVARPGPSRHRPSGPLAKEDACVIRAHQVRARRSNYPLSTSHENNTNCGGALLIFGHRRKGEMRAKSAPRSILNTWAGT